MGTFSDTDRAATYVPGTADGIREVRDDKARANIKAYASWEDDPAEWEADILAYLGLDRPARPASAVPLLDPSDVRIAPTRSRSTEKERAARGEAHRAKEREAQALRRKNARDERDAYLRAFVAEATEDVTS